MSTQYTNTRNYIIDSRSTTQQPGTNRWTVYDNFLDSLVDINNPDLVRVEVGIESMSMETGWFNVDETNNELVYTENGVERKIVIPPGKYTTESLRLELKLEGSGLRNTLLHVNDSERLGLIGNNIVVNNECSARFLLGLDRTKSETALGSTWYICPFPMDLRRIRSISVCTDLMPGQSGGQSRIRKWIKVPYNCTGEQNDTIPPPKTHTEQTAISCDLLATIPIIYGNISTPMKDGKLIEYFGKTARNVTIPKQSTLFGQSNRPSPFKLGSFDIWLVDQYGDTINLRGGGWHLNLKINSIIEPNKYLHSPYLQPTNTTNLSGLGITTEPTELGTKYIYTSSLGTVSFTVPSTNVPSTNVPSTTPDNIPST